MRWPGFAPGHHWSLLDDDLTVHRGMQTADVGVGPGLVELIGKVLVRIEGFGMDTELGEDDAVGDVVLVGPGDGRAFLTVRILGPNLSCRS